MTPLPITIITGFLGSGKTTLLLSLLPQLHAQNPDYKVALVKNEFGDLAVDSQLATSAAISSVRELLNGCICCNLVGSLSSAIRDLTESTPGLNRIVIETSGSAFPATLAMEVNRLSQEEQGKYALDGVVTVIDVENWKGYEDTSVTARLQAKYTDLIVFNKWELCDERQFEDARDRVGDLEVDVAWVKSDKGKVPVGLVFGLDGGLAKTLGTGDGRDHEHVHGDANEESHQSEVEVLSVTISGHSGAAVDTEKLEALLRNAPKDEVYRIKAVFAASSPIMSIDEDVAVGQSGSSGWYILNWAFGRWTCTPFDKGLQENESSGAIILRMTMIFARYESTKWKKKLQEGHYLATNGTQSTLDIEKIA